MKKYLFVLVFLAWAFTTSSGARSVSCEQFRDYAKLCLMNKVIAITTDDVSMSSSRNEIEEIVFSSNRNIEFLPILVHQTFPNMRSLSANNCSIQNVTRSNFDKLNKLQELHLADNRVEVIKSDTFRDLVRLKKLSLEGNRITQMNGQLFNFLPSVRIVNLQSNLCIRKKFKNSTLQLISDAVNQKCKFLEEEIKDAGLICDQIGPLYSSGEFCFLNGTTAITAKDARFHFMLDNEIDGLYFNENKKIEYLPVSVYRTFPNLVQYQANYCSVREISRKNFEKLFKLNWIHLHFNQIEKIASDTFSDLPLLRGIALNGNKIKHLNSKFLKNFESLNYLDLGNNECIQKTFEYIDSDVMAGFIDEGGCGFEEIDEPPFENLLNTTCGTVSFATGLIVNGNQAKKGQWPFLVALFVLKTKKFFCGASLVSAKHVLTAAHCVQPKNFETRSDYTDIAAVLGRHNIKTGREEGSVTRLISSIIIHPDWKFNDIKYDADLAVLVLKHSVEFSSFVQPVCITNDPKMQQYNDGYVVGWGKSEQSGTRPIENVPRQASIRSVSSEVCFEKDPPLGKVYTRRTYCAGGEGAGPCAGDSGGGFYVNFEGFWTIRGVVSAGAYNMITMDCDVDRYALYTKLSDFTTWIKETVNRT